MSSMSKKIKTKNEAIGIVQGEKIEDFKMSTVSIDSLPDNVLGLILNYCAPTEWSRLESVSLRWRAVADKHLGIMMIRGTAGSVHVEPKQNLTRIILKKAYAESVPALVALKNVPIPVNLDDPTEPMGTDEVNNNNQVSIPEVKRAEFIRKLSFVGPIPLQIMSSVLTACKTVSAVHLHFSALSSVTTPTILKLDVPTLKTLVIDTYGIKEGAQESGEDPIYIDFAKCLDFVISLLNNNEFMHIANLVLDMPFSEKKENEVVTSISQFLSRHTSLKSFCYHQGFIVNFTEVKDIDDDEDKYEVTLRSLAENSTTLKNVSLEEIQIHLITQQESDPLWKNFILHQNKMKKLIYTGNSKIPIPAATIRGNGATLETLVMGIRDTVDLGVFSGCSKLKTLVLIADTNPEDDYLQHTFVQTATIKNFQALPSSLEILSIRCLKVGRDNIQKVVDGKLVNLKSLELVDCGNENDLGIPIQMIGKIWEQKSPAHFDFRFSLNRKSLTEVTHSSIVALLAYFIKEKASVTQFEIDGILNDKGEYQGSYMSPEEKAILELAGSNVFTFIDESSPWEMEVKEFGYESGDEDDYESVTESESSTSSGAHGSSSSSESEAY